MRWIKFSGSNPKSMEFAAYTDCGSWGRCSRSLKAVPLTARHKNELFRKQVERGSILSAKKFIEEWAFLSSKALIEKSFF